MTTSPGCKVHYPLTELQKASVWYMAAFLWRAEAAWHAVGGFHAQVIQRQLEEVEEKQRALEENGVTLEKMLRGEMGESYIIGAGGTFCRVLRHRRGL